MMAKRKPPPTAKIFDAFREVFGLPVKLTVSERGRINAAIKDLEGKYPGLATLKDRPDAHLVESVAVEVLRRGNEYKQQYTDPKCHTPNGLVGNWSRYEHVRTAKEILDCQFRDWQRENLFVLGMADLEYYEAQRLFLRVVGGEMWTAWPDSLRKRALKWREECDYCNDVMDRPHVQAVLAALEAEPGGANGKT